MPPEISVTSTSRTARSPAPSPWRSPLFDPRVLRQQVARAVTAVHVPRVFVQRDRLRTSRRCTRRARRRGPCRVVADRGSRSRGQKDPTTALFEHALIGMSGHRAARPGQPPTRGQMHMILSVVTALASPSLRTAVPGRLLHVSIGVLTRRMASATGECTLRHRAGCRAVSTRAVTAANRRAVLRQPHCCSLCLLHRTQRRSGRHRGSGNPRLR